MNIRQPLTNRDMGLFIINNGSWFITGAAVDTVGLSNRTAVIRVPLASAKTVLELLAPSCALEICERPYGIAPDDYDNCDAVVRLSDISFSLSITDIVVNNTDRVDIACLTIHIDDCKIETLKYFKDRQ